MSRKLFISHESALFYWRTNPPEYMLEGRNRNIRSLAACATTLPEIETFCLTEAEFGPDPIHMLVPLSANRTHCHYCFHPQTASLPPHSLYPLRDGIHVVSPELCFVQMCRDLSFVDAAILGMELCGTYSLRPDYPEGKGTRDYSLIDARSLQRHVKNWKDTHGLKLARVVAQYLENGSASPMETALYLLLCLPQKYGGYNLSRPLLNSEIELSQTEREILRATKIKPDMLWKDAHLVVEYDGEYHKDDRQRVRDEKRKAVLEAKDYTVLQVKKQQVYDPLAFDNFAQALARRLGKRVRALTPKQALARDALREHALPTLQTGSSPAFA